MIVAIIGKYTINQVSADWFNVTHSDYSTPRLVCQSIEAAKHFIGMQQFINE